jgi:peptidylprolyl isomerase
MKFVSTLLFAPLALAPHVASAQTAKSAHPAAAAHARTPGCVKLPELSPKIPALPAAAPCAKALYTLTTVPAIKVDYSAPEEGNLRESLGVEPQTFTLAYIDTKVGTGELAAPHMYYSIQYTGYLANGTKFDSSYDHEPKEPFVFGVGQHQVIPGWDTGFAGMRVGGKRRLFIPFQLAYGPNGRPPTIPPRAELIFDLEFLGQSDKAPAPKTPPMPPPTSSSTPPTPPKPVNPGQPAAAPAQPPATAPAPATPPPAAAPASTPPPATPPKTQ